MTMDALIFSAGAVMGMTTMNLLWMWRCSKNGS